MGGISNTDCDSRISFLMRLRSHFLQLLTPLEADGPCLVSLIFCFCWARLNPRLILHNLMRRVKDHSMQVSCKEKSLTVDTASLVSK